jgi:hypothetical protein
MTFLGWQLLVILLVLLALPAGSVLLCNIVGMPFAAYTCTGKTRWLFGSLPRFLR